MNSRYSEPSQFAGVPSGTGAPVSGSTASTRKWSSLTCSHRNTSAGRRVLPKPTSASGWRVSLLVVAVTDDQRHIQPWVDRQHRVQVQYFQDAADLTGPCHHPEPGITRFSPLVGHHQPVDA